MQTLENIYAFHTPGPWKSSDRCGNFGDYNRCEKNSPNGQVSRHSYSVADKEGFIVAHCTNPLVTMSSDRSEANARLISAAPELLSALEGCAAFFESIIGITDCGDLQEDDTPLFEVRAAIAKAKGAA